MREDLQAFVTDIKDATNAVVLTHNIDFVFLQSVVLSSLRRIGQPTLTVFADAQCAAESFHYQAPVLDTLGTRYRVVPVTMEPGFRFHPKAVLISGPDKAVLLIGSGNLTFGGWRENAEVWTSFDTDIDGTGPFSAFYLYLQQILSLVPLRESVQAEIDEAFDANTRGWASELDAPRGLLGKAGAGNPCIDLIRSAIGDGRVARLTVCSPYFDPEAEALSELVRRIEPARTDVIVQKGRSGLTKDAATRMPEDVRIVPIGFFRKNEKGEERQSFIHAKFYAVEQDGRVTVFTGSANCSRAALTIPGKGGNAELMAIQELTPSEFQENYLDEFRFLEGDPGLPEEGESPDTPSQDLEKIRVLAARLEAGEILSAYTCSDGVTITHCMIDDCPVEVDLLDDGTVASKVERVPRVFKLEGIFGDETISSNSIWVDHEQQLRATARRRTLEEVIRRSAGKGKWNLGLWTEIVDVFCKHLQYLPPSVSLTHRTPTPKVKGEESVPVYTTEDVFSNTYGFLPGSTQMIFGLTDTRLQSLQQILFRWFGITRGEDDDNGTPRDYPPGGENGNNDNGGEDPVDVPTSLPPRSQPPEPEKVGDRERQKAQVLIDKITEAMTTRDFLERRAPELLVGDLKLIAVLLRLALREGWITRTVFFEATHRIWSALFFTSEAEPSMGWLEYRYRETEDSADFADKMISVELSAALASWAITSPPADKTPEYARFILSCILSIARLPWLWHGGEADKIGAEIAQVLACTRETETVEESVWKEVETRWLKIIRRGHALRRLEAALEGYTPAELRERITLDCVEVGELLWQGTSGFCVAVGECSRFEDLNATVLRLQGKAGETQFRAKYVIPLRALLDEAITPSTESFGDEQRRELIDFINEVAENFSIRSVFA